MLSSTLRRLSSLAVGLLFATSAWATDFVDLKFGQYQTADSQWNTSSCYYNPGAYNGCQIYSKNPGTTYKIPWTSGRLSWAAGDYIKFAPSGNASYPWTATQYNSNGTVKAVLGTGKVIYAGLVNADGYFFFMGNDNNTGQLFSMTQGMDSTAGLTFTGDINPDVATLNSYASGYGSTTPLAAGETATTSTPPAPTPVYRSSAITQQQATRRNSGLSETTGHNAQVNIEGDANDVYILQAGNGGHYASVGVQGDSNNVDVNQTSLVGARHYLEANIIGNSNIVNLTQSDTAKTQIVSVDGNNNNVTTNQTGTGNHFLDLSVTGDWHTANLTQSGSGNHEARVTLDGSQPWNFSLTQDGATSQKYTLPHDMSDGSEVNGTCSATGGCNLTINQQ